MVVFLLLSAPLCYAMVVSFYRPPSLGFRGLLLPYAGGILTAMGALIVTWIMATRVLFDLSIWNLFVWAWYRETGWPGTVLTALLIIIKINKSYGPSTVREHFGWFAGLMTIFMIHRAVNPQPGFEIYRLFVIPFLWFAMAGLVSWLLDRCVGERPPERYFWMTAALLTPSLLVIIPMLDAAGYILIAWTLALLMAALAFLLILLDSRGRSP